MKQVTANMTCRAMSHVAVLQYSKEPRRDSHDQLRLTEVSQSQGLHDRLREL